MPLLALDTSTRLQSVAVAADGSVLSGEILESSGRHSETLLPAVQRVLDQASLQASELLAVAVTSGPGSFTGLRVGLSTAKGLAVALGIPVAGFSSLKLLAEALVSAEGACVGDRVCALMEAGRGQLYRGLYKVGAAEPAPWRLEPLEDEGLVSPGEALAGLGEGVLAGGEGLARGREALGDDGERGIRFAVVTPSLAPVLAEGASWLLAKGRFPEAALTPNYIRPPDALLKGGRSA